MPLQISKECQSLPSTPLSSFSASLHPHFISAPRYLAQTGVVLNRAGRWPVARTAQGTVGGLTTLPEAPYFFFFFLGSKKALILPHIALPCQGPKRNGCSSAWVGGGVRRLQTHTLEAEEMGGATQEAHSSLPLFLVSAYYTPNLFHTVPSSIPAGTLWPIRRVTEKRRLRELQCLACELHAAGPGTKPSVFDKVQALPRQPPANEVFAGPFDGPSSYDGSVSWLDLKPGLEAG